MKKVLFNVLIVFSLIISFMASGISFVFSGENDAIAAETSKVVFAFRNDEYIRIGSVKYIVEGETITYNSVGFWDEANQENFKDDSGDVAHYKIERSVEPYVQYVNLDDIENGAVEVDKGTDVVYNVTFDAAFPVDYYISKLEFKQSYNPDAPSVSKNLIADAKLDGNVVTYQYGGVTLPLVDGYYSNTINTFYKFLFKPNAGGMEIVIKEITNGTSLFLTSGIKNYDVIVEGENITLSGDLEKEARESVSFSIAPSLGKIISSLEIKYGTDEVIKFYGGLCSDYGGAVAEVEYFFEFGHSYNNKFAFGNFALGFDDDTRVEALDVQPADKTGVKITTGYLDSVIELYIGDDGTIFVECNYILDNIYISVDTADYLQVNLYKKNERNGVISNLSLEPFESVMLNGIEKLAGVDEDDKRTQYFVVGFTSVIVKVLVKDGYSLDASVGEMYISGQIYERTVEAGTGITSLNIDSFQDESYTVSVHIYDNVNPAPSPVLFENYLKIYMFADKDGEIVGDTREDRVAYFKSKIQARAPLGGAVVTPDINSGYGFAQLYNVSVNTKVYMYVEVAPCFVLTFDGRTIPHIYVYEYDIVDNLAIEGSVGTLSFEDVAIVDENLDYYGSFKLETQFSTNDKGEPVVSFVPYYMNVGGVYQLIFPAFGGNYYPAKIGYSFVNFKDMTYGGDILLDNGGLYMPKDLPISTLFDVASIQYAWCAFIADIVYFATEIEVVFEANDIEVSVRYDPDDPSNRFTAVSKYDSEYVFVPMIPDAPGGEGFYFAGISYNGGSEQLYFDQDYMEGEIEVIPDGTYAGWYKILLEESWNIPTSGLVVDAIYSGKRYDISVVYVTNGTWVGKLSATVVYNEPFNIKSLNENSGAPFEDSTIPGKYGLVAWRVEPDSSINYIIDTEVREGDFAYGADCVYNLSEDARLVPVFIAGQIKITFKVAGADFYSLDVVYNTVVDEQQLKDVPLPNAKIAYTYLGFYTEENGGEEVLGFDGTTHTVNFIANTGTGKLFREEAMSDPPVYYWQAETNIVLYAKWEADFLKISLNISQPDLVDIATVDMETVDGSEAPANWYVDNLGGGLYDFMDFIIEDSFVITGIKPIDNYYISKILLSGNVIYEASCSSNAQIDSVVEAPAFVDIENGKITIVAKDFEGNVDSGSIGAIDVFYDAIWQEVIFEAKPVDEDGNTLYTFPTQTVSYKVRNIHSSLTQIADWEVLKVNGADVTESGWHNMNVAFALLDGDTLMGSTGASFVSNSGFRYYFKYWTFENGEKLQPNHKISGLTTLYAVFSRNFDVAINYFTFDDVLQKYVRTQIEGQFWWYNITAEEYVLSDMYALRSAENFVVNGESYYIKAWSKSPVTNFHTYNPAYVSQYLNPMQEIDLPSYSEDKQEINLFAVYTKTYFMCEDSGSSVEVKFDVPDAANGYKYTNDELVWVSIGAGLMEDFIISGNTIEDALNLYYKGNIPTPLHRGNTLSDDVLVSHGVVQNAYIVVFLVQEAWSYIEQFKLGTVKVAYVVGTAGSILS